MLREPEHEPQPVGPAVLAHGPASGYEIKKELAENPELSLDEALSWEPVVAALAAQAPLWAPGTDHGYHMRTYGWLVGELLRRTAQLAVWA